MNERLLEILEKYRAEKRTVPCAEITELLKQDFTIHFFVNLTFNSIRVYNSRFNCHIYNIMFDIEEDGIVIEKIIKL